jgi:hypothetical protein
MAAETPLTAEETDENARTFEQGIEIGKQWAQTAAQGFGAWAEASPEQVILVGLVTGFILGKLFLPPRRRALR